VFISNGPGIPTRCQDTVHTLRRLMDTSPVPIMGICLGHQLLGLAVGAKTTKLRYGNRAHNIPTLHSITGRYVLYSPFSLRDDLTFRHPLSLSFGIYSASFTLIQMSLLLPRTPLPPTSTLHPLLITEIKTDVQNDAILRARTTDTVWVPKLCQTLLKSFPVRTQSTSLTPTC
jgi:Glutamine amidotransferase class-I